jgi:hypothetical protein
MSLMEEITAEQLTSVLLVKGTRLQAVTPEGQVRWYTLESPVRVRLVPEEGSIRFVASPDRSSDAN